MRDGDRGFTLVELLAAIGIIAGLLVAAGVYIGGYIGTARQASDARTLQTLNDALTRYKTQGGDVTSFTYATSTANIINQLKTPINWNGLTHQILQSSTNITSSSLAYAGSGKNLRLTAYGTANSNRPFVRREVWNAMALSTLPTATNPVSVDEIYNLDINLNRATSYGQRVRGYIVPPATGSYTFGLSGDDGAELYLSTDATSGNATLIIAAAYNNGVQTATRSLTAGQRYYFMLIHAQGNGGQFCNLTWIVPGVSGTNTITSQFLEPL